MYQFKAKIAGHVALIETRYDLSVEMCRPFFSDEEPEFIVHVGQQDTDREIEIYERYIGKCSVQDSVMETIALHVKLSEKLVDHEIFVMHGAAVSHGGGAYVFSAPSGTGKTTHMLKWVKNLRDATVVNGDKPYIRMDGIPMVCGSPWAGKESYYSNTCVPLKAVVLMERAQENSIRRISFSEAFPKFFLQVNLFQMVQRLENPEKVRRILAMLKKLDGKVQFYSFRCNNLKDDCFSVSYGALCGEGS